MTGLVSEETYEYYRTSDLPSIERARGMNLELSDRQWKMLELDNFYHSNIWRYRKELFVFEKKPYVWLMDINDSKEVRHGNPDIGIQNDTFVVIGLHNAGDIIQMSPKNKVFVRWANEQQLSWKFYCVRAEDVYSNSINCYAIVFKKKEDYLLTKMTWV